MILPQPFIHAQVVAYPGVMVGVPRWHGVCPCLKWRSHLEGLQSLRAHLF
jgi:hypothetical protein